METFQIAPLVVGAILQECEKNSFETHGMKLFDPFFQISAGGRKIRKWIDDYRMVEVIE